MGVYTGTGSTVSVGQTSGVAASITHAVNAVNALGGAWTAYTPTVSAFGAGNGTASGRYIQVGKFVTFVASFTLGTTFSTTTNYCKFTLPATAQAAATPGAPVSAHLADTGVVFYAAAALIDTTTSVQVGISGTNGIFTQFNSTTPWTWKATDVIYVAGTYEAA